MFYVSYAEFAELLYFSIVDVSWYLQIPWYIPLYDAFAYIQRQIFGNQEKVYKRVPFFSFIKNLKIFKLYPRL